MKNEEILKHMASKFVEEITSAENYLNMLDSALASDKLRENEVLIFGLADMAKDEYMHAEFICTMMDEFGEELTDEHEKKLEAVERRLEKFFQ